LPTATFSALLEQVKLDWAMSFVVDWAKETAAGYLKTGIQAGGNLAGNAVGGVGSVIENGGRQFGEGSKLPSIVEKVCLMVATKTNRTLPLQL